MSQTSRLARQVTLDEAWSSSAHSEICCLIYATQNGWKLPILFEEMGVPYDWALVDFEKSEQRSERFLSINPNGRIPALIDRARGVTVAESGAILEYSAARFASPLCFPLPMRTCSCTCRRSNGSIGRSVPSDLRWGKPCTFSESPRFVATTIPSPLVVSLPKRNVVCKSSTSSSRHRAALLCLASTAHLWMSPLSPTARVPIGQMSTSPR